MFLITLREKARKEASLMLVIYIYILGALWGRLRTSEGMDKCVWWLEVEQDIITSGQVMHHFFKNLWIGLQK